MPPAILAAVIPAVVGLAGMANSNAQNKSTIKNNENQQAAAVGNAQAAKAGATNSQNAWMTGNPDPTNAAIAPVSTGAPGAVARPDVRLAQAQVSPLMQNAQKPVTQPVPLTSADVMRQLGVNL